MRFSKPCNKCCFEAVVPVLGRAGAAVGVRYTAIATRNGVPEAGQERRLSGSERAVACAGLFAITYEDKR